jgi:hypothetical protein
MQRLHTFYPFHCLLFRNFIIKTKMKSFNQRFLKIDKVIRFTDTKKKRKPF